MARRLFKFLLDENKPEEGRLIEYVRWLRSQRLFVTTLRRALTLIWTLNENDISYLEQEYPLLVEEIRAKARAEVMPSEPPDTDDIAQAIIERMKLEGLAVKSDPPPLVANPSGLKPLAAAHQFEVAMPTFDDDDSDLLTKRKDEGAGADIAANFLNAAFGMNDGQVH